jgi:hypothetical protein
MVIPYNQLNKVHSLMAIPTKTVKYKADHGAKFVRLAYLPFYDKRIADNAMTVVRICAEATHKSQLNDYASYEAAKGGMSKFICNVVNEIWYNDLKNADTFYMKVTAINIMALLEANSGGHCALGMITLCTNMTKYQVQADGIPQFIVMMEDAQKKATRAGMPIADVELVMIALAAVLAAQHFPCKADDCKGLPTTPNTWQAWKVAFRLAHLKRQCQLQASGGGEPLGGAHAVIPTATSTIDRIGVALKNLALAALNDTTVLQQLTAANLLLTALVTLLTAANKKLADALAQNKGGALPAAAPTKGRGRLTNKPFLGNYCWTHGHQVNQNHTSATCGNKATGHKDDATSTNKMGGSNADKGWNSRTEWCGSANLVDCKNINLCKNNYYYALSIESAPTPPSTFPHQHTGFANSGSSGFWFSCGSPVAN